MIEIGYGTMAAFVFLGVLLLDKVSPSKTQVADERDEEALSFLQRERQHTASEAYDGTVHDGGIVFSKTDKLRRRGGSAPLVESSISVVEAVR